MIVLVFVSGSGELTDHGCDRGNSVQERAAGGLDWETESQ